MYLRSKGSDKQTLPVLGKYNFWRRNMQNPAQETDMSSIELESVSVSGNGTRSCKKDLLQPGRCVQELDVPVEKHDTRNSSIKSICYDVVLSGNDYDYLGP